MVERADDKVSVTREVDGGLETVKLPLPPVSVSKLKNEAKVI